MYEFIKYTSFIKHSSNIGKGEDRLKNTLRNTNIPDEASGSETTTGFTAFNMKEELEEGHFDTEGHYIWKKDNDIRDNWLDNIDWLKVCSI